MAKDIVLQSHIAPPKTVRQNYDLPTAVVDMLNEIKTAAQLSSTKDAIITCVTTGYWAMNKIREGRVVAAVDENTKQYIQLYLPAFEVAKMNQHVSTAL